MRQIPFKVSNINIKMQKKRLTNQWPPYRLGVSLYSKIQPSPWGPISQPSNYLAQNGYIRIDRQDIRKLTQIITVPNRNRSADSETLEPHNSRELEICK
jgi:hypothetical protein